MWGREDSREVGLEAATLERVRNSSPVECPRADNVAGLSQAPKLRQPHLWLGRGASASASKRSPARARGAVRSENAGMSSEKGREKRPHRKPEVSDGRFIRVGLVGPKPRPRGVGDGQLVSNPAPVRSRLHPRGDPGG
jgi:hypothetical protein